MQLHPSPKTLCVFVDDTGHEELAPGHAVYGLGGCAVLAQDLDRHIRQPWHEVRRRINGSADAPLHAATFSRTPSPREIEAIAEFFQCQPFARLGAIVSAKTKRGSTLAPIDIIAGVLKNRIVDIARWTPFSDINVVFEASKRADPMIEKAFGDFRIEEGGKPVPVECFFMPKAANDPALEVADFIMHAIGRQARRRLDGKQEFAPDFAAVFHNQDPKRVSFIDIEAAEIRAANP